MEIQFTAADHKYISKDDPTQKWLSATGLVELFKPNFNAEAQAIKSAKNKKSKWYGMKPQDILDIWAGENKRAVTLGSWYHDQREQELIACDTIQRNGVDLPIFRPIEQDGIKLSPDQNIAAGIYPEHLVYLKSVRLCGQADRIEVVGNTVNIYDYKTNKEIKLKSYVNWEGKSNKLNAPLEHLDDCNFYHYALQMSLYMYITLKHNHSLKPGKMEIHHIIFDIEGYDDYGYPIVAYDAAGDPIVKELVPYEMPYLKKEVNTMINYLKLHPEKYK